MALAPQSEESRALEAQTNTQHEITVLPHPFNSPLARQLISELDAELLTMYPEPEKQTLDGLFVPDHQAKATEDDIDFMVAFTSAGETTTEVDQAAGCVAIKLQTKPITGLPAGVRTAELKRMFTRFGYRGPKYRVGQHLLAASERRAKEMGIELLVLETGIRQGAAMRLYNRNGWTKRSTFGVYAGFGVDEGRGGVSVCYEKSMG